MKFDIDQSDIAEYNKCPSCLSTSIQLISECKAANDFAFMSTSVCQDCGHVFRNKVPSEGWFNHAFELRHNQQKEAGFNPLNPEIEQQRYDRYAAIGNFLNQDYEKENKQLLDIGCGPGTGLDAFRDLGFSVVGVDPDESRAKIAVEKGHQVHTGEFGTFETNQTFDYISLIHSLEHFQNQELFLEKALKLAHEDTLLYVEVPEVLDHVKDWNDSLYLAHISNFNAVSLKNLAQRCGWEQVKEVNPYLPTPLHRGHLAIIFKPSGSTKDEFQTLDTQTVEEIGARYYNGLPGVDNSKPVTFVLKEINDISLGYKGIKELKSNVHDNYANRSLEKTSDNTYEVS